MKIISISGLDGSGKSTQIEYLKRVLEKSGYKVYYFHATNFSIGQLLRKARPKGMRSGHTSVTRANWLQIQLRKLALLIDLVRFRFLLKKLKRKGYDFLVSDRYFYDSILNIAYLQNHLVTHFSPRTIRPMKAFYLNVSPQIIMRRERHIEQGLSYLKAKKYLYDSHASIWDMIVIDGNRGKKEIFEDILNHLSV